MVRNAWEAADDREHEPAALGEDRLVGLATPVGTDLAEVVATQMAPYSLFARGPEQWVEVSFPRQVEVPRRFWIVLDFRAGPTKGVYVSYDTRAID